MPKPLVELPFNQTQSNPFDAINRPITPAYARDTIASGDDEQGNVVIVGRQAYRWKKSGSKFYLALEPAATNRITDKSEDFLKWTLAGTISVFAKTQIGPTGDYDADEIVFDATQTDGVRYLTSLGDQHGQTLTFSVWAKASAGTPSIRLRVLSNTEYESVKALTTSWTRFSFTQTLAGGDTNQPSVEITPDDTSAPTIYLYGAQLEQATIASTYLPTTPVFKTNRNLVVDGDMELEGVANWTVVVSGVLAKSSTANFGRQSLKITGTTDDGASQTIAVVNGSSYKLSGWINVTSGSAKITATNPSSNASTATAAVWTYFEVNFKATSTTTVLSLLCAGSGTVAYFDRVQLILQLCPEPSFEAAGTPPSPWALVGSPTYDAETIIVHSTSKAAKLTCASSADGIYVTNTDLSLSNNTWYQLSCWVYIVSQSGDTIVLELKGDASYNITLQLAKSTVGSWQKVASTFKTGTLVGGDAIIFHQNAAGSLVFILDDVSIVALDVPVVTRNAETLSIPLTNPQPSNLLTYSEQFDNAAWAKSNGATISANATTAPDGNTTADKFVQGANSTNGLSSPSIPGKVSTLYCFSCYVRVDQSFDGATLRVYGADTVTGEITRKEFSLSTKWRRIWLTFTSTATSNGTVVNIDQVQNDVSTTRSWPFYLWGAQLEEASSPSQYIKTTSAAQSPIFTNYASSNFSKVEGSLSFWAILPFWGTTDAANASVVLGTGGSTGPMFYREAGETNLRYWMRGLSKSGANLDKHPVITGAGSYLNATTEHFLVLSWSSERDSTGKLSQSRVKAYIDGAKLSDDTYTDVQKWKIESSTVFDIGGVSRTQSFFRDLKIWPSSLNDQDVTDLYVAG